ncbi:MAG: amidohydrolase family protein [Gemmatimonadales bacterium]|jgi:imidazolonepropionase-like amidohydrolase
MTARSLAALALLATGIPGVAASQSLTPPPRQASMGTDTVADLAIEHVTVVDVRTGRLLPGRTVLVVGDRIEAVLEDQTGAGDSPAAPEAARAGIRIDGRGRFLVPGLWDMHTHVLPTSTAAPGQWWEPDPTSAAKLLLANGVTGVRDMWGSLEAARRWRAAGGPRPRLLSPGGIIDGPVPWFPGLMAATSATEARHLVDSLAVGGADFIKVYNTLPLELLAVVVEQARRHGLRVVGHVPNVVRARDAARAGMAGFEHLHGILEGCSRDEAWLVRDNVAYLEARAAGRNAPTDNRDYLERLLDTQDDERCDALIRRLAELGVAQTPTLVAHLGPLRLQDPDAADDPRLAYVPDAAARAWQPSTYEATRGYGATDWRLAERRLARMEQIVGRMQEAGLLLLAGSDVHPTLAFTFPGFSLQEELTLLVESGLTPLEALRTATLNPATFLGHADDMGAIAAGYAADLVLLEADPLEDIGNTSRIAGVVRAGTWLPRDTLDAWTREVAAAYRGAGEPRLAPLPPGAVRVVESGERRAEFRYVFLLDPKHVEGDLPTFIDLRTARETAAVDPALQSFLTANPQFDDWAVASLEIGSYDGVRVDGGDGRRTSMARWWVEAHDPGVLGDVTSSTTPTLVELGRWSAYGSAATRVWVRGYGSGTWAFHLEALELGIDVVCRPGGARWHESTGHEVLIWPGERIPDRYIRQVEAGEVGRDCETRLSAAGLAPLAAALREAPFIAGTRLGARLIEGGEWRRGIYITK